MGLGVEHVQSERGHYVCFMCVVCNLLVDVDAVVTTTCSHPFCRTCLMGITAASSGSLTQCPACAAQGDVVPLVTAQPLAHSCMTLIRISCPNCSAWQGEYGKLNDHKQQCQGHSNQRSRTRGLSVDRRIPSITPSVGTSESNSASNSRMSKSRDFVGEELFNTDEIAPGTSKRRPTLTKNAALVIEANILKEKGNARFNKGEFPEAKSYYDQAISLFKDAKLESSDELQMMATLYCNRGAAFARAKNTEAALRDYDESIRLAPDYGKAYTRKFKMLAGQGRLVEAKALLEGAVQYVPGDKNMMEDLRKTRQIVDGLQLVIKLLQIRNYAEAKTAGDSLLKLTDNAEAVLLSAEADASLGLIDAGLEKCEFVLKANPTSLVGLRAKGYIALLGNDLDTSCNVLKEALRVDPNNSETKQFYRLCRKVQTDLAEGRACAGKAEGSRTILRKAVDHFSSLIDEEDLPQLSPLMCMLHTERGELELQLTHYPSALTDARIALEGDPANVRARIVKSEALIATGRAAEAREELQVARRTHGRGSEKIRDAFIRADFECKILEADKDLRAMVPPPQNRKEKAGGDPLSRSDHNQEQKKGNKRLSMDSQVPLQPDGVDGKARRPVPRRNSTVINPSEREGGARMANRRRSFGDRPQSAERRLENADRVVTRKNSKESPHRQNADNGRGKQQLKRRPSLTEAEARRRVSLI